MKFQITLLAREGNGIPINYQYPVSAAIYKVLRQADEKYAHFLHETGYQKTNSLKTFKLFTFSDLSVPFTIDGDRMVLKNKTVNLTVSFHLPQAAETFIKGLFLQQEITIADRKSKTIFTVSQVEALPVLQPNINEVGLSEILIKPSSPIVCGKKNEKGNYDFLSPEHPDYTSLLISNWKEKYTAVYGAEKAEVTFLASGIEVILNTRKPKSRLITIKAGTAEETKIRGFMGFELKIRGTKLALELAMNAGLGIYNSLGMGSLDN